MTETMNRTETERDSETHWNVDDGRAACGSADGHFTTNVEMASSLKCLSAVVDADANVIESLTPETMK